MQTTVYKLAEYTWLVLGTNDFLKLCNNPIREKVDVVLLLKTSHYVAILNSTYTVCVIIMLWILFCNAFIIIQTSEKFWN